MLDTVVAMLDRLSERTIDEGVHGNAEALATLRAVGGAGRLPVLPVLRLRPGFESGRALGTISTW